MTAALAKPDLKYIYMANRSVPAWLTCAGPAGWDRCGSWPTTTARRRGPSCGGLLDSSLTRPDLQSRKALSLLFDGGGAPDAGAGLFYPESPSSRRRTAERLSPAPASAEADSGKLFLGKAVYANRRRTVSWNRRKSAAWAVLLLAAWDSVLGDLRICDCGHSAGDRGGLNTSGGSGKAGIGVRRLLRWGRL